MTSKTSPYTYLGMTVSICSRCHRSLAASVQERASRVFLTRTCPEHGRFRTLIASDAEWYHWAQRQTSPTLLLRQHQTEVRKGCPFDCGVCPEHQQNNALPAIDITDVCNLDCPVCFAHNLDRYYMSAEEMDRCLDVIEASGTQVDALVLTGGEPTAHPRLVELIEQCYRRPFVPRVGIATNGIRIAKQEELAAELGRTKTYVLLQLDSLVPEKNRVMRGKDMVRYREDALAHLARHGVTTVVLMTIIRGLNDDEVGEILTYALRQPFVGSFQAQTISYTGRGGSQMPFDPTEQATGTDLIDCVVEQSDGLLRRSDFLPMLHPHPSCIAVTYLLRLGDGSVVPFPRFTPPALYREAVRNQFIARPDERHEEFLRRTIDHVWAHADDIEDAPRILDRLKDLLCALFSTEEPLDDEQRMRIAERYVKNVLLHNMIDDYNFDAGVLRKCTSMQVTPDGRMIPHCAWRVLYRHADPRWADHPPPTGHGLDGLRRQLDGEDTGEDEAATRHPGAAAERP